MLSAVEQRYRVGKFTGSLVNVGDEQHCASLFNHRVQREKVGLDPPTEILLTAMEAEPAIAEPFILDQQA